MMQPIFNALTQHAQTQPDAIAFAGDDVSLTWSQLQAEVADLAARLADAPSCVGIGLHGGCAYVVADLALTLSGRRQVPLPFFFGSEQITHVMQDAGLGAVITDRPEDFAGKSGLRVITSDLGSAQPAKLPRPQAGAERVIYTSGSSGRPKGVVIANSQMMASLNALSPVIAANAHDRHLSILPLAQLLEQICGIYLPVLAGAETSFDAAATHAVFGADIAPMRRAFERERPTTSLLAPALLGRWVADLQRTGASAPDSLRFVAVGGAASAPDLLFDARACGIPVHEGYGLSECCAVVAMNRPGEAIPGTVGPVLPGLDVRIIDGEITVAGSTVMQGYLNGAAAPARWFTGDMGRFENGRLIVDGRKDNLIVTGAGRNISPEWIEQRVNADPRIASSALVLRQDGVLILIVAALAPVDPAQIVGLLDGLPDYARPQSLILVNPAEPDLLFPAGTPNRKTAQVIADTRPAVTIISQNESLAS
ncbi:AMP-binding protein [Ruegeria arenilitoris]|uniref:AMP-binding protein n=1 Tax=Ruegeria arenilitoris TaxID=1173585 RepID=UPI00147B0B05|nr:AMP-binding protein [Ruegeria arenilitoris]